MVKTTYANKVAGELKIPLYKTDDFYNEKEKRMLLLKRLESCRDDSHWIIEGVLCP